MNDPTIKGVCPACGSRMLYLRLGRVVCERRGCPRPDTVSLLLEDVEIEHIVRINLHDFTIRHPLRERVGTELLDCSMHKVVGDDLAQHDELDLGTYRVRLGEKGDVLWEATG